MSSASPRLAVLGSANVDYVVRVSTLPTAGETVVGGDVMRVMGGKGANQAAVAASLGVATTFLGAVGTDRDGDDAIAALGDLGVDVSHVSRVATSTGVALIAVGFDGDNQIVVSPGANVHATASAEVISACDVLLAQLEIPHDVVARAAQSASLFVLNVAPANTVDPQLVAAADLVIANETEWAAVGASVTGPAIVTLGARGARWVHGGEIVAEVAAPPVDVMDAVGAGDAFSAAATWRFALGDSPIEVLRFAAAAGSLATTGPGARGHLPTVKEVESWLARGW